LPRFSIRDEGEFRRAAARLPGINFGAFVKGLLTRRAVGSAYAAQTSPAAVNPSTFNTFNM
jgi:hypothetical protein